MRKAISIGAVGLLASLMAPSASSASVAKGDFNTCGERPVASVPGPGSYELILKVKGVSCDAGQKVAHKYFKNTGTIVPEVGSVEFVQHYRCQQKNYYAPYKPSFECRNSERDRVVKGLYPPEGVKSRPAGAKQGCRPVESPYPGTRYADVDLTGIRADGVNCPKARRVATRAHREALAMTPPADGILRYSWNGWSVVGNLIPSSDRFRATRNGKSVHWRF